jgi:2-hydroxychromene-2-carboxylate isomerase
VSGRPRFYLSFRSPYSWLAYRDLVGGHPDLAQRLEWRPFWEPDECLRRMLADAGADFPYVDMSRAKALYILQDVRRLARRRGLRIAWPVDRNPVWEVAHLAYLVARRQGLGAAFTAAVYEARWEHGRDISDRATIADIAAGLGFAPDTLANAADDPQVRREGLRALLDVCADGVFGVPFFVHGRQRYWGVDRLPEFADAVSASGAGHPDRLETAASTAPIAPAGPAADLGHAGGCG